MEDYRQRTNSTAGQVTWKDFSANEDAMENVFSHVSDLDKLNYGTANGSLSDFETKKAMSQQYADQTISSEAELAAAEAEQKAARQAYYVTTRSFLNAMNSKYGEGLWTHNMMTPAERALSDKVDDMSRYDDEAIRKRDSTDDGLDKSQAGGKHDGGKQEGGGHSDKGGGKHKGR
eukprot:jgi/Mesvir1/1509/Mv14492-RA.1